MKSRATEINNYLLTYLGEEKILELSSLIGNKAISFTSVMRYIKSQKIKQEVVNQMSVKKAATSIGVHRSTIYRQLKKKEQIV